MIRVNLLKDIAGGVQAIATGGTTVAAGPDNKDAIKKLVIMAMFPILTMAGFTYLEMQEEEKIAGIRSQVDSMKDEVEKLQPQIKAVRSFQEEKKQLEIQVEAIKQLSKERLLNVRALNTVQEIIPKEVWLKKLKLSAGKIEISGMTTTDRTITEFLASLNQSIYFRNTVLIGTREEKDRGGRVLKAFDFQSELAMEKE
ncbi:MAG: PilN domain-containing protein [Bdellovibrionales bacterium]|nr:PilN domain-containing protein [Bdellovibrionales bacterium]